jgi:protein-S-isoprenylcysteine O-methyltransferase Ste14
VNALDWIRYGIAFIVLASHLPSLFLWLAIHPFSGFWRKLGAVKTYAVLTVPVAVYIAVAWKFRVSLLGSDFGSNGITVALAGICVAAAFVLHRWRSRSLDFRKLSGVPELSSGSYPGELLTQGAYGVIRHPRYIEALLWVLGYCLFANYSGPYAVWLVSLPVMCLVVALEERELRRRFGSAYEEYCRRVPRFLPKLGAGGKAG